MKRRDFMALAGAVVLVPVGAIAGETEGYTRYRPGVVADLLADGKTVFVDFYTDWCSTCRAQERAINALRLENPAYNDAMVFVKVDWDVYYGSAIAYDYKIPRRSTLLVLRGDQELGRNVADASKASIKSLMDLGLTGS
ncbi:MAG: thioredoxin family protein [Rhodobacterales bacterium]|jgi:thioredoxin 1|nr:thioredoxin family protein [Rhodobacter sp.]